MKTIETAYDPNLFRKRGHRLVDLLASYLERAAERDAMPVLDWTDPSQMVAWWPTDFPEMPTDRFDAIVERVLAQSNHLHHPRFIGHQVAAPLPSAALCDLIAALLNNGMAVYEMGPAATAMEQNLVAWFAKRLGYGDGAGGVLTSGGSVGNLTALLAARQAKAGFDIWDEGNAQGPRLAVLVSDQAHYCIRRAVQIMGWGESGAIAVASDARYRMRMDALETAYDRTVRDGVRVIGVVASAASTATGSFDPLEPIADFCQQRDLWFHVDGAHGASVAMTKKYRHLVAGIERADSVVWDAHKMMMMPALVTLLLFRDGRRSYEAFSQQASYLFSGEDPEQEWYNLGTRTLECTKRMMSLKLYAALAVHGTAIFDEYVTATIDLAKRFARRLATERDFELAVDPEANVVCFRYVPEDVRDLDALQTEIRRQLLASGGVYIVQTRLPAGVFLRTTVMNAATTDDDLDALIEAIRAAARA